MDWRTHEREAGSSRVAHLPGRVRSASVSAAYPKWEEIGARNSLIVASPDTTVASEAATITNFSSYYKAFDLTDLIAAQTTKRASSYSGLQNKRVGVTLPP